MEVPSIMQSVITPRSTPIQHLAFPVSKDAVKNFREKLEKNIEYVHASRPLNTLRDILTNY